MLSASPHFVSVFGAGPIGLAAVGLAEAAGAGLIVAFDISPARNELAKKLGADYAYDPREVNPSEILMELSKGEGFNFHLEAAGAPHLTVPEMVKSLAINGKISQIGRAAHARAPRGEERQEVRETDVTTAVDVSRTRWRRELVRAHVDHGMHLPGHARIRHAGRVDHTRLTGVVEWRALFVVAVVVEVRDVERNDERVRSVDARRTTHETQVVVYRADYIIFTVGINKQRVGVAVAVTRKTAASEEETSSSEAAPEAAPEAEGEAASTVEAGAE